MGSMCQRRSCLTWPPKPGMNATDRDILLEWPGWCGDYSIWCNHGSCFWRKGLAAALQLVQAMVDRDGGPVHAVPTSREPMGWPAPVEMSGCLKHLGRKRGRVYLALQAAAAAQTIPPLQRR